MHGFADRLADGQTHEVTVLGWLEQWYDWKPAEQIDDSAFGIDYHLTNRTDSSKLSIQIKADTVASRTGNAFIETVSVDTYGKPGWVFTCQADRIFYYLPFSGTLFILKPDVLQRMAYTWVEDYGIRTAANDGYHTYGCPVPLTIVESVASRTLQLSHRPDKATPVAAPASETCGVAKPGRHREANAVG